MGYDSLSTFISYTLHSLPLSVRTFMSFRSRSTSNSCVMVAAVLKQTTADNLTMQKHRHVYSYVLKAESLWSMYNSIRNIKCQKNVKLILFDGYITEVFYTLSAVHCGNPASCREHPVGTTILPSIRPAQGAEGRPSTFPSYSGNNNDHSSAVAILYSCHESHATHI